MKTWIVVAALLGLVGRAAAHELPFRPLTDPGDRFTASDLTMVYGKDSSPFLSPSEPPYLDLDELDRYRFAPADTSRRVFSRSDPDDEVVELTPQEKDAATPPTAGVQVGIPSYISVPGTLIGGAALLVKVLSELF